MSEIHQINPMICHGDTAWVKRTGNVCSVFVDGVTGVVQQISSYEDSPDTAFAVTLSENEVKAAFRGKKIVFIDAPKPPLKIAQDALTEERMEAVIDETMKKKDVRGAVVELQEGVAPVGIQHVVPTTTSAHSATVQQPAGNDLFRRVEDQFKMLLAKRSVASGKLKKELTTEIENVASFLLAIDPSLAQALSAWVQQSEGPRFKL